MKIPAIYNPPNVLWKQQRKNDYSIKLKLEIGNMSCMRLNYDSPIGCTHEHMCDEVLLETANT